MSSPNRQLCSWIPPSVVAQQLIKTWGEAGLIWLDGDGSDLGRWVTLAVDPIEEVCCRGLPKDKAASNPFEALRNLKQGHWTGWLSYEAAAWIEPSNPWKANEMATLWMACHDPVLKFDLQKHQLWVEGCNQNRFKKITNWLTSLATKNKDTIHNIEEDLIQLTPGIPLHSWQWLTNQADYSHNVNFVKE